MPSGRAMTATADPKCVPVRDIIGNLQVRRMCGRHNGGRKPITRQTLIRWRRDGFPEPIRVLPGKFELWDARDVKQWLRDNRPVDVEP